MKKNNPRPSSKPFMGICNKTRQFALEGRACLGSIFFVHLLEGRLPGLDDDDDLLQLIHSHKKSRVFWFKKNSHPQRHQDPGNADLKTVNPARRVRTCGNHHEEQRQRACLPGAERTSVKKGYEPWQAAPMIWRHCGEQIV